MKLRMRNDPRVIADISDKATFYPSLGPLGEGWVDEKVDDIKQVYSFKLWEPVPVERWMDVTSQVTITCSGGIYHPTIDLTNRVGAKVKSMIVKRSLWDCLDQQTQQLLHGFQQFIDMDVEKKLKTTHVLKVEVPCT